MTRGDVYDLLLLFILTFLVSVLYLAAYRTFNPSTTINIVKIIKEVQCVKQEQPPTSGRKYKI